MQHPCNIHASFKQHPRAISSRFPPCVIPLCQEFNELEYYTQIPGSNTYRYNYWGYSTVGFFAPMSRCGLHVLLSSKKEPLQLSRIFVFNQVGMSKSPSLDLCLIIYISIRHTCASLRYSDAAAKGESGRAVQDEFKTMVKECHK